MSDEFGPATYLNMDESHRPVKLRKVVLGFPCNSNQTDFKFDLSLNYKMANIIQTYSDQKPALVVSVGGKKSDPCVNSIQMFDTFYFVFVSFAQQEKEPSSLLQFWPKTLASFWALSTNKGLYCICSFVLQMLPPLNFQFKASTCFSLLYSFENLLPF